MKLIITAIGMAGILLVISFMAGTCMADTSCDQHMYDLIYETIIDNTMKSPMGKDDFKVRNDSIENLRKLCKGQKSTWELN